MEKSKEPGNSRRWLTKSIMGIALTSLFSDMGHEMTTAILPMFLVTLGGTAATLGLIEGTADGLSSLIKLWMGYYSDRVGKRKTIATVGYVATALKGVFAFAISWHQVLLIRVAAWMGRGARGPVRDAMMTDLVEPAFYGRAFGFHTAMDTLGAVIGPLIAFALIGVMSYRQIFLISFIPGFLSVACFVFLVKEKKKAANSRHFMDNLSRLPAKFRLFILSAGIFGLGNFAHTLLILKATELLTPHYGAAAAASVAIALYTLHNVLYAVCAYPAGLLSEKVGTRVMLGTGYFLFAVMCLGFILLPPTLWVMILLFMLAGVYMALVDSMERALAGELLPEDMRGTGYGVLSMINGFGDIISSVMVGFLWTKFSSVSGFAYACLLTFLGAVVLLYVKRNGELSQD